MIVRDLIYVIPEWSGGFPYFFQFKSEFCNKEFKLIISSEKTNTHLGLKRSGYFPFIVNAYVILYEKMSQLLYKLFNNHKIRNAMET